MEDGVHIGLVPKDAYKEDPKDTRSDQKISLMRRIPRDAEACTVLVGCVEYLEKPAMAFIRLAEKQVKHFRFLLPQGIVCFLLPWGIVCLLLPRGIVCFLLPRGIACFLFLAPMRHCLFLAPSRHCLFLAHLRQGMFLAPSRHCLLNFLLIYVSADSICWTVWRKLKHVGNVHHTWMYCGGKGFAHLGQGYTQRPHVILIYIVNISSLLCFSWTTLNDIFDFK